MRTGLNWLRCYERVVNLPFAQNRGTFHQLNNYKVLKYGVIVLVKLYIKVMEVSVAFFTSTGKRIFYTNSHLFRLGPVGSV
jgi:hypothetical protein